MATKKQFSVLNRTVCSSFLPKVFQKPSKDSCSKNQTVSPIKSIAVKGRHRQLSAKSDSELPANGVFFFFPDFSRSDIDELMSRCRNTVREISKRHNKTMTSTCPFKKLARFGHNDKFSLHETPTLNLRGSVCTTRTRRILASHAVFCFTEHFPWWFFNWASGPPSCSARGSRLMMMVWAAGWAVGVEAGSHQSTAVGLLRTGDRWESRNTESLSWSRCFLSLPLFITFSSALSPVFPLTAHLPFYHIVLPLSFYESVSFCASVSRVSIGIISFLRSLSHSSLSPASSPLFSFRDPTCSLFFTSALHRRFVSPSL